MRMMPTSSEADRWRVAPGVTWRKRFGSPVLGWLLVAAGLTGCTSLPKPGPEWSVRHPVDTKNTTWARTLAPAEAEHPDSSGVELLRYGHDALAARVALADTAERSLDLQYYTWKPDATGQLLAERMIQAADRGVRVRLLLDDIGGSAPDDALLALDRHTNIEVRLFNPVASRTFRMLSMLFDFQRVSRRMHNKSFTVDDSVTIVGGRNVEERYYAFGEEPHFADFDVLAVGPAVGQVAPMFDRYWYSPVSIPVSALIKKQFSPEQLAEIYARLAAHVEAITNSPDFETLAKNEMGAEVRRRELTLAWGPTWLVCDLPEKITTDVNDTSTHLAPKLRQVADATTNDLVIVSPYFVPGPKGVEFLRSLRKRGVRVVVLSNSLAANDVTAVHVGYRRYRKPLLYSGVEMWEIKPDVRVRAASQEGRASRKPGGKTSRSALHAKTFFFDHQTFFVGSLNLDPHSMVLNTEMGLVIGIPELAGPTVDSIEAQLPQKAYRLEFIPGPGPCKECGRIRWHSLENGKDVVYKHEPQATFSQRLLVSLLSFLPIESQL